MEGSAPSDALPEERDVEAPSLQMETEVQSTAATAPQPEHASAQMDLDEDGMPGLLDVSDSEDERGDEDLPGLMDISDSDDSDDENGLSGYDSEVDRIVIDAALHAPTFETAPSTSRRHATTVEDDPDEMPPLEPVPHRSRRVRVEDDIDDEDRPRSRNLNNPSSSSSNDAGGERPMRPLPRGPPPLRTPPVNPLFAPGGVQPLSDNANQMFRELFRNMLNNPTAVRAAAEQAGIHTPAPNPAPPRQSEAGTAPTQNTRNEVRQDFFFNFPGGPEDQERRAEFDAFLNSVGNEEGEQPNFMSLLRAMVGNAVMGMMPGDEKEDPERAKKLISGLEVVPHGLVKRLERVGDKCDEGSTCGDASCAVCWDSLLNPESEGFGTAEGGKNEESTQAPESVAGASGTQGISVRFVLLLSSYGVLAVPVLVPDSTIAPEGVKASAEPTTQKEAEEMEEGEKPKIVALPCSHVFHASCLQPWFSRPGQTTCPSCRFNIDPENLTYTPRPVERPPRQPRPFGAAANAAGGTDSQPTTGQPAEITQPANPQTAAAADTLNSTTPPGQGQPAPQANGAPNRPRRLRPVSGTAVFTFGLPGGREGTTMMNFGFGFDDELEGQNADNETADRDIPDFPGFPGMDRQAGTGETLFEGGWTFSFPQFPGGPPSRASQEPPRTQRQPRERKEWTIPPPPGFTLRQRIEKMERDAGLRCSDVSCGIGPSDDDPIPEVSCPDALKHVAIQRDGGREQDADL